MTKITGEQLPRVRFPGFMGAWSEERLGNLMTFKNGVNADKSMYGSGYKFINVLDIISSAPITHRSILGRVEISKDEFNKNEVIYGDVLFQRSSEVREETGQSNIYIDRETSATFGGFVIRGRPIAKFDPVYFNALLSTAKARKDITSRSGGSTRYNVGQESLALVLVNVAPSLPEQKKIADFLGAVDAKLAALREKEAALTRFKRGLMQALFSQTLRFTRKDGSNYPDWEEKRLGDLGHFIGGGTPDTSQDRFWKGEIPWVSSSDILNTNLSGPKITRWITPEAMSESATRLVPMGSLLIVTRVGVGKLTITAQDICTSQDFTSFVPIEVNAKFVGYQLLYRPKQLLRLCQGTSIKGLTTEDLQNLKLKIPHHDEQKLVTDALSALDLKIFAVNAQIAQTSAFKAGLLQQMFT